MNVADGGLACPAARPGPVLLAHQHFSGILPREQPHKGAGRRIETVLYRLTRVKFAGGSEAHGVSQKLGHFGNRIGKDKAFGKDASRNGARKIFELQRLAILALVTAQASDGECPLPGIQKLFLQNRIWGGFGQAVNGEVAKLAPKRKGGIPKMLELERHLYIATYMHVRA